MEVLINLATGEVSSGESSGLSKLFRLPQTWLGIAAVAIVLANKFNLALSKEEAIGAVLIFIFGFAIGKAI